MARELAAWARREGLASLLLAAGFGVVALHDTFAMHGAAVRVAVAAIYLAIAVALVQGADLLARLGAPGAVLSGIALATIGCWHLREQTDLVHFGARGAAAAVAFASLAAALAWTVHRTAPRRPPAVATGALVCALAILAIGTGILPRFWPDLRWHLTAHHRMIAAGLHRIAGHSAPSLPELFESVPTPRRARPLPALDPERLAAGAGGGPRPDVVLVIVDTLRADALAAYGGDPAWMPHLNRLAARASVFANVRSNAPWTSPSVASLFTGLLPEEHGLLELGDRLVEENLTLAEVFERRGYDTAAFVANAAVDGSLGFGQGFDLYHAPHSRGAYPRAERLREAALRWLSRRSADAPPLFLYLHFMDPHTPYESGDAPRFWQPSHHRPAYLRELAYLDAELGRMLPALRRSLGERALLLLTSDHGEAFGEHGGYGHGHALYRELLRIPAIVDAGNGRSEHIDAPLEARDFFHLLAETAHRGPPALTHWAEQRRRDARYASTYATPRSWHALGVLRPYATQRMRGVERSGRALFWSSFGDTYELYDLERDPEQQRNLAASRPEWLRPLARDLRERPRYAVLPGPKAVGSELAARLQALGYVE